MRVVFDFPQLAGLLAVPESPVPPPKRPQLPGVHSVPKCIHSGTIFKRHAHAYDQGGTAGVA